MLNDVETFVTVKEVSVESSHIIVGKILFVLMGV